jgi:predicted P-loop ATPase
LNRLIPPALSDYKFIGTINPDNKDALVYLSDTMLINLDELETLRRAQIGSLKTIMTMESVMVRRPYDKYPKMSPRRASFVGSINSTEFLNDPTGSRRFLTFEVANVDYQHSVDMNNVYAQAYSLYQSGAQWWFDQKDIEEINERNSKFAEQSYEFELVSKYLRFGDSRNDPSQWRTASEVAGIIHETHTLVQKDGKTEYPFKIDKGSVRNIGSALTMAGYQTKKVKGTKLYHVKLV